jgi:hypothetical protein
MNVKTNPNIKAQMINLNFGFWNLTFSHILILASCNLHLETFVVPTFFIPGDIIIDKHCHG